ncbi:MAG: hypothetical protein L0Z50_33880 [Verrucomicrobiales bacterium]|nr:hypothetical protein [Verrucomicrobiales bacterium]
MRNALILAGCVGVVVVSAIAVARLIQVRARPTLSVVIVSPTPNAEGIFVAEASRMFSVKLSVTNAGRTTLTGLLAKAECLCYFKGKLPATLQPGETSVLDLQLPTPPAGRDIANIQFLADGHAQPIQSFAVTVLVPAKARTWLHRVDRASGTAIASQEYSTEIVLEAIEDSGTAPWVESIAIEPIEFANAQLRTEERHWTDDDAFVIRSYRVQLCTTPQFPGIQKGTIVLRGEPDGPPLAKVQVHMEVIAPLAALPEKVELRTGEPASVARVDVVSRLPPDRVVVPQFDDALIAVTGAHDAHDRRLVFEIRPKSKAAAECTTAVKFAVDGGEPATVEVRMLP